ncbi:MAG TPA: hypothetical protein VND65_22240 [Candidatus Binatia bacterium]|nr:hypothetical protein [Candidatus Binatia bacterium]
MAGLKKVEYARRMAIRIVQAMWRFDAESLISLRSVMDRIIKTKQATEKSVSETIGSAGQLKLSYKHGNDRRADIEVESSAVNENTLNEAHPERLSQA